jgi:hypothetical protein
MTTKETTFHYTVRLLKADSPHVVYGVVYEPCSKGHNVCKLDTQGDWVTPEELRKAAWAYMEKSRTVGSQHRGPAKAVPVESFIAPVDMDVDGETIKKGSWVVGVKINDEATWEKVESGILNAFSIGGKGVRVPSTPSGSTE